MKVSAIIPAAGLGLRMGTDIPKQFLLLDGKPILHHTLSVMEKCPLVDEIILVVAESGLAQAEESVRQKYPKVVKVVLGGRERQDSVYNGLIHLKPDTGVVVVHDGVRPFVPLDLIRECIEAARDFGAAIAAIPLSDTIKKVNGGGWVEQTVDRTDLWRVQTPQAFQYPLLKEAFEKARDDGYYGTDEGSLIEYLGREVKVIPGSEFNIKITRLEDLALGEKIAAQVKAGESG